jgi:hypothetical protein
MPIDPALNKNMEYISLDYNKELPLSDSDMKNIEDYLQSKYNVKIYTLTYGQLVEKGLHDQSETKLKGGLLKQKNICSQTARTTLKLRTVSIEQMRAQFQQKLC